MKYTFAFELSPQERTDIESRKRRGPRFHWRSTAHEFGWAFLFLGTAITGTLGWILARTPSWYDVGGALLGWTYIALLVVPAVFRRLSITLAGTYGVATPARVTADERGVTEVLERATHEQWGWDELRNVRSDKKGVLLEFRDGKSCWIPARAFQRAMKRAEFVEYADRMRRPPDIVIAREPQRSVVTIASGEWRWDVEGIPPHTLRLIDPADERNRLAIELDEHDDVSADSIGSLTGNPDRRAWVDEMGVEWLLEFPDDDTATAVPTRWPAGSNAPSHVVWVMPPDTAGASRTLPWFGLGHLTQAELLRWFHEQRSRLPHSETAGAE